MRSADRQQMMDVVVSPPSPISAPLALHSSPNYWDLKYFNSGEKLAISTFNNVVKNH